MPKFNLKRIFDFFLWINIFLMPVTLLYPFTNTNKKFDGMTLSLNSNLTLHLKTLKKVSKISITNHQFDYNKKENFFITFNVLEKVNESYLRYKEQHFSERKMVFPNSLFKKFIRNSVLKSGVKINLIHKYEIHSNHFQFFDIVKLKEWNKDENDFNDPIHQKIYKISFLSSINLKKHNTNHYYHIKDLYFSFLFFNKKDFLVENFYSNQSRNFFFKQVSNKILNLKFLGFNYYMNRINQKFAIKLQFLNNNILNLVQYITSTREGRDFSFFLEFNFPDPQQLFQKQSELLKVSPIKNNQAKEYS